MCCHNSATILQSLTGQRWLPYCIHMCCFSGRKALLHCSNLLYPGQIHIAKCIRALEYLLLKQCLPAVNVDVLQRSQLLMVPQMCQTVAFVWPFSRPGWTLCKGPSLNL